MRLGRLPQQRPSRGRWRWLCGRLEASRLASHGAFSAAAAPKRLLRGRPHLLGRVGGSWCRSSAGRGAGRQRVWGAAHQGFVAVVPFPHGHVRPDEACQGASELSDVVSLIHLRAAKITKDYGSNSRPSNGRTSRIARLHPRAVRVTTIARSNIQHQPFIDQLRHELRTDAVGLWAGWLQHPQG